MQISKKFQWKLGEISILTSRIPKCKEGDIHLKKTSKIFLGVGLPFELWILVSHNDAIVVAQIIFDYLMCKSQKKKSNMQNSTQWQNNWEWGQLKYKTQPQSYAVIQTLPTDLVSVAKKENMQKATNIILATKLNEASKVASRHLS